MGRAAHLSRRFFSSLWPGGPSRAADVWARSHMTEGESALWRRMWGPDRRHAVKVAREVERSLGHEATTPVLAAALLHDVGKIESGLHTYGRVVATLSAGVAGKEAASSWVRGRGFTRRVGLYLLHPKLGGDHLGIVRSDPLVEAWARQHHLPESEWTIEVEIGRALRGADDD